MKKIPETIDEMLATPGCPICGVMRHEEFNFIVSLACECSRSGEVPASLIEHPFCNYHAWEVGKIASHDTWALILVALLEKSSEGQRIDAMTPSLPDPTKSCLLCLRIRDREAYWLGQLAHRLRSPEFQEQYRQSGGLCLPHARAMQSSFPQEARAADLPEHARRGIAAVIEKLIQTRMQNEFRYMGRGHGNVALATEMLFGRRGHGGSTISP